MRIDQIDEIESMENKAKKVNPETINVPLKLLRLRFLYYKLSRTLGVLDRETDVVKLEKEGLNIYSVFLQAMESHPSVQSTVGVAQFHSNVNRNNTLSDLDI